MKYNSRTIKQHKGRLIELTYKNKHGFEDNSVGEIIAHTVTRIIFHVNKATGDDRIELTMKYENIVDINPPEKKIKQ